jgi:thiamine pyrophosphate-dependent acetolactate synthase large subunit-like protein
MFRDLSRQPPQQRRVPTIVRREEGAALAAAGQAKLTGQLGVYCGRP